MATTTMVSGKAGMACQRSDLEPATALASRRDSKAQTAFAVEQVDSGEEEIKASLRHVGNEFLDHYKDAVSTDHP